MCGGKVIETIILEDSVWVNVQDKRDICAVYVDNTPESRSISDGDSIWWQGGYVFWTAKNKKGKTVGKVDYKLKKRGFSGVSRPNPPIQK